MSQPFIDYWLLNFFFLSAWVCRIPKDFSSVWLVPLLWYLILKIFNYKFNYWFYFYFFKFFCFFNVLRICKTATTISGGNWKESQKFCRVDFVIILGLPYAYILEFMGICWLVYWSFFFSFFFFFGS